MRAERVQAQRHRPFDPSAFDAYCELLGQGITTLDAAPMIKVPRTTLYAWIDSVPDAADKYARARERQAEAHADQITQAANRALSGDVEPNAARVFIDAMKWQASKLRPKVYGERLDIALETRSELLVLDYSRSEGIKAPKREVLRDVIDVKALPSGDVPKTGKRRAPTLVRELSKSERMKLRAEKRNVKRARWSKARRAKSQRNHDALMQARRKLALESSRPKRKR